MCGLHIGRSDWFYGGRGGKSLTRCSPPGSLCSKHMDVPGAHVLGEKGNAPAAEPHRDGDVGSAAIGGSLVARGGTGWHGVAGTGGCGCRGCSRSSPGGSAQTQQKGCGRVLCARSFLSPCAPMLSPSSFVKVEYE